MSKIMCKQYTNDMFAKGCVLSVSVPCYQSFLNVKHNCWKVQVLLKTFPIFICIQSKTGRGHIRSSRPSSRSVEASKFNQHSREIPNYVTTPTHFRLRKGNQHHGRPLRGDTPPPPKKKRTAGRLQPMSASLSEQKPKFSSSHEELSGLETLLLP